MKSAPRSWKTPYATSPALGNWATWISLSSWAAYRDQRLMVVFVPLGEAEKETFACGVCGFLMDAVGEGSRFKLMLEDAARAL